ncbi:MAG: hypothetical protein ACRDRO_03200, partial [Pseudonocardiaceae bacterium]
MDLLDHRLHECLHSPSGRLILSIAPQSGKTTLARWAILRALIEDPERRVVLASYAVSLARSSGRLVRGLVETHGPGIGLSVDREHRDAADWQLEGHIGGLYVCGVGGALTGKAADCLSGETTIITSVGTIPVSTLVRLPELPLVLSWNHATHRAEWRAVRATRAIPGREVVDVHTRGGKRLRCTPEHRLHVRGRGYVEAGSLRVGDELTTYQGPADVPLWKAVHSPTFHSRPQITGGDDALFSVLLPVQAVGGGDPLGVRSLWWLVQQATLRGRKVQAARFRQNVLFQDVSARRRIDAFLGEKTMRDLWSDATSQRVTPVLLPSVSATSTRQVIHSAMRSLRVLVRDRELRAGQEASTGWRRVLLAGVQRRLPSFPHGSNVRDVWSSDAPREGGSLLLAGMPVGGSGCSPEGDQVTQRADLSAVRGCVQADNVEDDVLHPFMRERGPLQAHDGYREFPVPRWPQLRGLVPKDATTHLRAGRESVRGLWSNAPADYRAETGRNQRAVFPPRAPHQRGHIEQQWRQSDTGVQDVPRNSSQVSRDTVSVVRRVREGTITVYDLQVEGNRNFFAGEILVHNCLIVDDALRGHQDADSDTIRGNLHDWWESVARTRLAPGAPVVV